MFINKQLLINFKANNMYGLFKLYILFRKMYYLNNFNLKLIQ